MSEGFAGLPEHLQPRGGRDVPIPILPPRQPHILPDTTHAERDTGAAALRAQVEHWKNLSDLRSGIINHLQTMLADVRAQLAVVAVERDGWQSRTAHAEAEGCEQDSIIFRLEQRVDVLTEALRPFAYPSEADGAFLVFGSDVNRARAAVRATPGAPPL